MRPACFLWPPTAAISAAGALSLRTVRLLKPLRTISTNQAMRTLVTALVNCVPMLINVLALWMLVFVLFGIVGMQLWMGQLHNCCTDMHTGARLLDEVTSEARRCGGRNRCPAGVARAPAAHASSGQPVCWHIHAALCSLL
jgi:hypothetical protein